MRLGTFAANGGRRLGAVFPDAGIVVDLDHAHRDLTGSAATALGRSAKQKSSRSSGIPIDPTAPATRSPNFRAALAIKFIR